MTHNNIHCSRNALICIENQFIQFNHLSFSLRLAMQAGRGDIHGMHRFIHYNDPYPIDVRYLSITTGFGNDGSWILDDDEGMTYCTL